MVVVKDKSMQKILVVLKDKTPPKFLWLKFQEIRKGGKLKRKGRKKKKRKLEKIWTSQVKSERKKKFREKRAKIILKDSMKSFIRRMFREHGR